MVMKNKEHFSCENCRRKLRITKRNGYICSGQVREPFKHDVFRLCYKNHTTNNTVDFNDKERKYLLECLLELEVK